MNIFKCKICGTMVEEIKYGECHPTCCGETMELMLPGTSDGAREKHLPVYSVDGNKVSVNVGSEDHPMTDAHYIEWIAVKTTKGMLKRNLEPGDAPKAEFLLSEGETVLSVFAYCNLHGLWKWTLPR